jgi:hypothetical protein
VRYVAERVSYGMVFVPTFIMIGSDIPVQEENNKK